MDSVSEFIHMGGYAFYVWSAYGLTAICLVSIVVWSARQHKRAKERAIRRSRPSSRRAES